MPMKTMKAHIWETEKYLQIHTITKISTHNTTLDTNKTTQHLHTDTKSSPFSQP